MTRRAASRQGGLSNVAKVANTANKENAMATVLVVDDSAFDRELVKQVLAQDNSISIETVDGGMAALKRLKTGGIDLVLTDLQMPEVNGLQVVTTVRIDYPDIPVILMTGDGTEVIAMNALAEGAANYVPKRMLNDWLLTTVHEALTAQEAERTHQKLLDCFQTVQFELELHNDPNMIQPLVNYVQQMAAGIRLGDPSDVVRLGVALRGALENAMYRDRVIEFELRMNHYEGRFRLAAKDGDGPIFDAAALPEESDPDAIETTGSRDFLLLRSHMDEVVFNDSGSKVILYMRPNEEKVSP